MTDHQLDIIDIITGISFDLIPILLKGNINYIDLIKKMMTSNSI